MRDAEQICLDAEGEKWRVYQEAITSGEISISDLLDFAVDFYSFDGSWSGQLMAALEYYPDYEKYCEEIFRWEELHSVEYQTYRKLKKKFENM